MEFLTDVEGILQNFMDELEKDEFEGDLEEGDDPC